MTTTGFIGLGRMGRGMAANLQRKGFPLTVYDLSAEAMTPVTQLGAKGAASAAEVGAVSDVLFTMLPNSPDVEGVARELAAAMRPGGVVVDMSTIDPLATDRIAALLGERGIGFVDAPVGRLASHADRGESLFMVGAREEDFARIRPRLEAMGTTIIHCGGPGAGMRMKLVNNYVAISLCQLNAEALALMQRFGLDLRTTLDVLGGTTATNGQLSLNYASKVLKGDTEPGFMIDLAHKDMSLAVDAAHALKLPVAVGKEVREALNMARAHGYGGRDFSALLDHWCEQGRIAPPRF
jgi:4-hydroxybutyrate dehydrogenase/sulfolactaldehyde 3-reductase